MYIIVRGDIEPGLMLSQSCHALSEFLSQYPTEYLNWYKNSNYIVILSVKNESDLKNLLEKLRSNNLKVSAFHEPDLNNELTSIAVEPSSLSKKLLSSLPTALKKHSNVSQDKGKEVIYE